MKRMSYSLKHFGRLINIFSAFVARLGAVLESKVSDILFRICRSPIIHKKSCFQMKASRLRMFLKVKYSYAHFWSHQPKCSCSQCHSTFVMCFFLPRDMGGNLNFEKNEKE